MMIEDKSRMFKKEKINLCDDEQYKETIQKNKIKMKINFKFYLNILSHRDYTN